MKIIFIFLQWELSLYSPMAVYFTLMVSEQVQACSAYAIAIVLISCALLRDSLVRTRINFFFFFYFSITVFLRFKFQF